MTTASGVVVDDTSIYCDTSTRNQCIISELGKQWRQFVLIYLKYRATSKTLSLASSTVLVH